MSDVARVVSGGQSGVDRAALDAAISAGVPYGGWCPAGGWAEDFPDPPGLLAVYPHLRPTASDDPTERTVLNVRDSTATLVLAPLHLLAGGALLTVDEAARTGRPHLVTTGPAESMEAWLADLPQPVGLNVAGPRASEWADGYDVAHRLLTVLLRGPGGTAH